MQQHKHADQGHQRKREPANRQPERGAFPGNAVDNVLALQRAAGNQATNRAISNRQSHTPARPADGLPPVVESAVRGDGQPLEPETAATMAERFGQDFSHVRLHTGASAGASAEALRANAYTVGSDIVFGPGRYVPGSTASQQLLAHELAHVAQQSRGGSAAPNLAQYGQAEREASAAASGTGPVSISQTVSTGTVQMDNDWLEIGAAVALGPVGYLAARESGGTLEDAGSWILGAIGGEFVDDPTYGQIAVDFVLSIIPYVDQAADVRDIIAHIYRLGFRSEYTSVLRWVALVFTLIGLVPEIGSVIKSLSKAAIRFVGRNLDTILRLARRLLSLVPEVTGGMRGVRRFIASHWDEWANFGRGVWDTVLSRGGALVDAVTTRMRQVLSVPDFVISQGKRFLVTKLNDLRRMSAIKLPDIIKNVKDQVLNKLDDLAEHFGPRTATAGGPDIPTRAEPLQMSATGGGGRRTTTTTVEELTGGPRTTGEAIDELDETVNRGSRTRDPRETGYTAEAGRQIERGEVARWAERLGPSWTVTTRAEWPPWLRRVFPRGGPDMIAINAQRRQIIVGDIAPNPRSRVDVRPGTGAGPPARQRGGPGSETTRAGDEGTRLHIEKTIEDAQRVARNLPENLRNYRVFAQEWYWEHGEGVSRRIPITQ